MTKTDVKRYACIHGGCAFQTVKRKAIYTHLVRTHSERREDFECEYCATIFHDEDEIERHLKKEHSGQLFTYTCVSRIEGVLRKCARLGSERRRSSGTPGHQADADDRLEHWINETVKIKSEAADHNSVDDVENIDEAEDMKPRTKASVNASLNSIAKTVLGSEDSIKQEPVDYEDEGRFDDDDRSPSTVTSQPSGLKIKLNLKQISECPSPREASVSPPLLQSHQTSPEVDMDTSEMASPPHTAHGRSNTGVEIREKASKYFDKLEVYHTTDEFGMRCCPFCPYKTSKNTIRVHLSGIHKIYFVKCSLCDYKAAFPHQITQHGVKFHKTTNLNVIQLSKETRERVIAKLQKLTDVTRNDHQSTRSGGNRMDSEPIIETDRSEGSFLDDASSSGSCSASEEEDSSFDTTPRAVAKQAKSQTMKTDYFSIEIENGVQMFCCRICSFRTSVRATIYTHKYRHEQKSYRCGYCEFISFPRSNVAHHCRYRHKDLPVKVVDTGTVVRGDNSGDNPDEAGDLIVQPLEVKLEPADESADPNTHPRPRGLPGKGRGEKGEGSAHSGASVPTRSAQTIIKVPEYRRSLVATTFNTDQKTEKRKPSPAVQAGYKLSINKLYRFNPLGSPKYVCARCPYACDTHPKMKHHLYRHRPQCYKCPYCEHRKYPRSYVVRHVRDTHRGKPLRVLDLSNGDHSFEDADLTEDPADAGEEEEEGMMTDGNTDPEDSLNTGIEQDVAHLAKTGPASGASGENSIGHVVIKTESTEDGSTLSGSAGKHVKSPGACRVLADRLQLNLSKEVNDKMFLEMADVSPNFSETVYTSTPLIESIINNGQFPDQAARGETKSHEKKKSTKDYRVNSGPGPRYTCNKCGYSSDNYKTIHNHMYRHEAQRYQCPYCGYRRSPRSFVENHVREVHKGNPVFVTELTDYLDQDLPQGSPRQCVNLKRKAALPCTQQTKKIKGSNPVVAMSKLPVKWPAPKPATKVNMSTKKSSSPGKNCDAVSPKSPVAARSSSGSPGVSGDAVTSSRYKEGSRTTFKTMYKCVFDPETCNHISKDKSKMKQHLFMHVEYKPWTCDLCDMTASQSSHIKHHVRSEHPAVSDMSFHYKKHNYLEKHIQDFLSRSLLTVPVSEYRRIMDMKGSTKSAQRPAFARDAQGWLLCPYCDFRTKSGNMTDHVKMKHMQARFKCHWCDYSAFYRSEVRKHHHKERSHALLEFKTQELDLSQTLSKTDGTVEPYPLTDLQCDPDEDEPDDGVDSDGDLSSNGSSGADLDGSVGGHCSEFNGESDSMVLDSLHEAPKSESPQIGCVKVEHNGSESSDQHSLSPENAQNKFRCGYCSFSASLRVKVKMHCSKKHADSPVKVTEPRSDKGFGRSCKDENGYSSVGEHITRVDANDWKGTKFEHDLRRAGVSKLNLSSLFTRSKKVKTDGSKSSSCDEGQKQQCIKEELVEENHTESKSVVVSEKETDHAGPAMKKLCRVKDLTKTLESKTEPEFKIPKVPSPSSKTQSSQKVKHGTPDSKTTAKLESTSLASTDENGERINRQDDSMNDFIGVAECGNTSEEQNSKFEKNAIVDDVINSDGDKSGSLSGEHHKSSDRQDDTVDSVEGTCDDKDNFSTSDSLDSQPNMDREISDKADIIVEPLEPENIENEDVVMENETNSSDGEYLVIASMPTDEQAVETADDQTEAKADDNDQTSEEHDSDSTRSVIDENVNHINKEETDMESVILKTVPNFTPVVLETEEVRE